MRLIRPKKHRQFRIVAPYLDQAKTKYIYIYTYFFFGSLEGKYLKKYCCT